MRKALRISLIVLGSIILLLLLTVAWLTTPSGKNFLRKRTIVFLEKRLNTDVYIGSLDYKLLKMVELKGVIFLDTRKDTMLAARRMRVDITMLKLLRGQVEVSEIQIDGARVNLYRIAPDTAFNFDYVVRAFAAPPSPRAQDAPTDSTGQLQLDIRKLTLREIFVRYDDYTGGDRFSIALDTLDANVRKVDPYNMDYRLRNLYINGFRANFSMDTSYLLPNDDTAALLPYVMADEIHLKNFTFDFKNNNDKVYVAITSKNVLAHPKDANLNTLYFAFNDAVIDTSSLKVTLGKKPPKPPKLASSVKKKEPPKLKVTADSLKANLVDFILNDDTRPTISKGMDYAHMNVQNGFLEAIDASYTIDTIQGNIKQLAAKEKSGLDVKKFRANFMYHPQGVWVRNVYLKTPYSSIKDYAEIKYPSLKVLSDRVQSLQIQAHFKNSVVGMHDVLIFAPQLLVVPMFKKYENDQFTVNSAIVSGYLDALNIKHFQGQGFDNSYVDVSGMLFGLPDVNKFHYNFNITKLRSTDAVANTYIPNSLKKQIDLPSNFTVTGKVSGTVSSVTTDIIANTSDGDATIKGLIDIGSKRGNEKYDLHVDMRRLNVGKIVKQSNFIGHVSANVYAKGTSFDINYMNAMLRGEIHSAAFMGYAYRNVKFNARVANKDLDLELDSKDPNANLTFDGSINFKGKYPAIVGRLAIDSANLQALKLYKDDLRVRGNFDLNIQSLNPDYPEGSVGADYPTIVLNGERYYLDTVYVTSTPNDHTGNHIVVYTDAAQAVLTGHIPLTQIGNVIQSHINRHYSTNREDSIKAITMAPESYDLHIRARIQDDPVVRLFLPGLQAMDESTVDADIYPHSLIVNALVPAMQYNNMLFDSAKAKITGSDSGLYYSASVNRFGRGNMEFWFSSATGKIAKNVITSKISISDSAHKEQYALGAVFHQHGDRQEFHIDEGLVLNYVPWKVSQPNAIVFSKEGFYAQNFLISRDGQSISLNSTAPRFSAPMEIGIKNFLLSNITAILSKDTLPADGVLNGDFTLQNMMTAPKVAGTFSVNNLSVRGDTIGNIAGELKNATENSIEAKVTVSTQGNDVILSGFYYPKPVNGNNFNFTATANNINLSTLEGLAQHQIKNSSGSISGNVKIRGTFAKPLFEGELRTKDLKTTIAFLGTPFLMPSEKIVFNNDKVEFKNFRIVDETGNAGTLNGTVGLTDLSNMPLNLRFRARQLQVVNSTVQDNELFYGKMLVSANLKIGGTTLAPDIDGDIIIHDTTKVTAVVPQSGTEMSDTKGIVEFIDMDDPNRYKVLQARDTSRKFAFRTGADINVNITLQKNAEFNVIVDQSTGDFVKVRGEANLNTTLNPDGTLGLVGTFDIHQGVYELNYNFIRRRFHIQSGSTITFTGDPMQGIVNATAVYTTNIAPYDLVARQIEEPSQLNYYKQRLPFDIVLNLQGPIMKPEISFDVRLSEVQNVTTFGSVSGVVEAKLNEIRSNPTELNKQVFAVILLNRFVADNPFESGVGTTAGYIARQSVSNFLSDQLNNLADDWLPGIDLTLNLQTTEDYTTGERRNRTDLNLAASKRLINDRLTVTIGNNFELEGGNQARGQNTSLIPGNLALDYQLTKSGRYLIRLYRKELIEDVLEGYIVQTGANFIATAEYNRFRNLFISRKKQMQKAQQKANGNSK